MSSAYRRLNKSHDTTPSAYDLELKAMPQSGPYGYYLPYHEGYRKESCHPSYADGVITPMMLDALVDEINLSPVSDPNACTYSCLGIPVAILLAGLAMYLGRSHSLYWVILIGAGTLLVLSIALACLESNLRDQRRRAVINDIINKHKMTTFRGINVLIELSTLGSYLKIRFSWKLTNEEILASLN